MDARIVEEHRISPITYEVVVYDGFTTWYFHGFTKWGARRQANNHIAGIKPQ